MKIEGEKKVNLPCSEPTVVAVALHRADGAFQAQLVCNRIKIDIEGLAISVARAQVGALSRVRTAYFVYCAQKKIAVCVLLAALPDNARQTCPPAINIRLVRVQNIIGASAGLCVTTSERKLPL